MKRNLFLIVIGFILAFSTIATAQNAAEQWAYIQGIINGDVPITGARRFANGTASAPSITFTNSTGLGLYRNASNVLGWSTAASHRMSLDASGRFTVGSSVQTTSMFGVKNSTNQVDILLLTNEDGTEKLAVDSAGVITPQGVNMSVIIVTTGTYAVLAVNTGKVHVIPDLAGDTSIDLPAEVDGLNYEFWYTAAAVETHDHSIDSESNTNFFIGGISWLDSDAGDAADEVHLGIYSDGNSTSKIVIQNMAAGTWIKVICDGTNWYVTGQIISDTIPTIEDQ